MNDLVFISWLIGIYFATTGTSFTIINGHKIAEKISTETAWQEQLSKDEKNVREEHRDTDSDYGLHSNIHYLSMEDDKSKADNVHVQTVLDMGENDGEMDHNLDRWNSHRNHTQHNYNQSLEENNKEMQETSLVSDNDEYEEIYDIEIQSGESSDLIQNNQQFVSNEQQSEDTLLSDKSSEDYERILLKPKAQSEELDESDKGEYLGDLYDDEELKYIFNITQHNNGNMSKSKRETVREINSKEVEEQDAIYLTSSSTKKYINIDNEDDYNEKVKYENNDTRVKPNLGDVNISQEENEQAEEGISRVTGQENNQNEDEQRLTDGEGPTNRTMDTNRVVNPEHKHPALEGVHQSFKNSIINKLEYHTSTLSNSESQIEQKYHSSNTTMHSADENSESNKSELIIDPCTNFQCKRGKICDIDEEGYPICVCQDPVTCFPANVNDHVCGTDNKTYESPCHLFGTKCNLEGTKQGSHLHLDYQGPCKYISPCSDYELTHFPLRMRDWLKNVLMQLYERDLENPGFLSEKQRNKVKKIYENEKRLLEGDHNIDLLTKDFEKNYHMYVYPVHWQFAQLDKHSTDRLLTRSELAPLRAPLIPMEHCVTVFFQGCNGNKDKHISLREWCQCFGIRDEDIDEDILF
ncbi:SPARC-like protein 1 [Discoglossus pictus]